MIRSSWRTGGAVASDAVTSGVVRGDIVGIDVAGGGVVGIDVAGGGMVGGEMVIRVGGMRIRRVGRGNKIDRVYLIDVERAEATGAESDAGVVVS